MRDFKGSYMVENKCSGVTNSSQLSSRYGLSFSTSIMQYIPNPCYCPPARLGKTPIRAGPL